MNCERIQELILTDHLDGVLDSNIRKELERHMTECPSCQEFARTAKLAAVDVFDGVKREQPPEYLWSRIEDSIQRDNESISDHRFSWFKKFTDVFAVRRPAFVLATLLVLFLAAGTMERVKTRPVQLSDTSVEYITALMEPSVDPSGVVNDFGTDVEQVFL